LVKILARPPEGTSGGRPCMAGQPPHRVLKLYLGNTGIRVTHQEMHPTLDTVLRHGMVCIPPALNPSDLRSQPGSRESAKGRGYQGVDGTDGRRVRIASPPSAVRNTQCITQKDGRSNATTGGRSHPILQDLPKGGRGVR